MIKKQTLQLCLGVLALAYICSLTACSTTRIVKPLKAKEVMIGADFGGPLIGFGGGTIPLPFTSVVGAYGVDSNLTVFGAAHLTAATYGNIQLELGGVYRVYQSKKQYIPSISGGLSTQLLLATTDGRFRIFPVADVNLYWQYLKSGNNYAYVNWSSLFDFFDEASGQANSNIYRPSFGIGHTFENAKMRYTIEGKYMLPGEANDRGPVQYRGVGGKGAFGVYIGISRKF